MADTSENSAPPAVPAAAATAAQPSDSTRPPGVHEDMDTQKTISPLDSQ